MTWGYLKGIQVVTKAGTYSFEAQVRDLGHISETARFGQVRPLQSIGPEAQRTPCLV